MRRALIAGALVLSGGAAAGVPAFPEVHPGDTLEFPADEGSHPAYRTEWWYVTGWLKTPAGAPLGFQVTFFATRPGVDAANPSAFAAREVLIAHAALSDPKRPRALHAERAVTRALAGGCTVPVAAHAEPLGDGRWRLYAYADRDGVIALERAEGADPLALADEVLAAIG